MVEIFTTRHYITFSGRERCNRFLIESDGSVLAWDDVAEHFTQHHTLTPLQQVLIKAEVRKAEGRKQQEG